MTIYFVDEDFPKLKAWAIELEYLGYTVRPVFDADRAFTLLRTANDIEWVVIDVMLAGSEQSISQYTEDKTDQGLTTGLTLLANLTVERPDYFPWRAQLLTAATNNATYRAARECATRFGVPLMFKADIDSPREFGRLIVDAIASADGRKRMAT